MEPDHLQEQLPPEFSKFRTYGSTPNDKERLWQLLQGRLWFSRLDSFNDPFEGKPAVKPAFDKPAKQRSAVLTYLADIVRRERQLSAGAARREAERLIHGKTLSEVLDSALAGVRRMPTSASVIVYCVSGPPAITAPLTWSHYADSHRGVCVHFDSAKAPFSLGWRVHYSSEYPEVVFPRTARFPALGPPDFPI